MAGIRITGLGAGTPKATDLYVAVDTTDTSMALTGTDKKYLLSDITTYINAAGAGLTATYVGFGDPSNLLTGNANLAWDNTNVTLRIGGGSTDATAILKLDSTTKLFYVPTQTTTQRTAITPSRGGAIEFDSTLNQFFGWNGSAWVILG